MSGHLKGPHQGNWSVFAERVAEQRDAALERVRELEERLAKSEAVFAAELARQQEHIDTARRGAAERQREADIDAALRFLTNRMHAVFRDDFSAALHSTPLVTGES